jgi:integrase
MPAPRPSPAGDLAPGYRLRRGDAAPLTLLAPVARLPHGSVEIKGASLKTAYVRALLPRLAARAGIEKRVHPHGLRHTHAAELAREGTPLNLVQAQLGHSSLATTDGYLRHIAPEELVKAMKARIWSPPED